MTEQTRRIEAFKASHPGSVSNQRSGYQLALYAVNKRGTMVHTSWQGVDKTPGSDVCRSWEVIRILEEAGIIFSMIHKPPFVSVFGDWVIVK